jgi:7-carboxy-7-deazaguanine synthase
VKFVIADEGDWLYTKYLIEKTNLASRVNAILISPAWGEVDLQKLANWIAGSGLNVRLQLQLHKYIWGPDVKGV